MSLLRRLCFIFSLCLLFFIAHHGAVYIHEWTHGLVAWLAGYKSSPFAIYYGVDWFTLWDIDEAVDYARIYSDGKAHVVGWIAIAPMILQMVLFPLGLKVLRVAKVKKNRGVFALVYFFTLIILAEIYAYIPIRTFAPKDDMYNFIQAIGISPWIVAIIGTLYLIWGIYEILALQTEAYTCLKIPTTLGCFIFTMATLILFFGYYGAVGFTMPDPTSQLLSQISWAILFLSIFILCLQVIRKKRS